MVSFALKQLSYKKAGLSMEEDLYRYPNQGQEGATADLPKVTQWGGGHLDLFPTNDHIWILFIFLRTPPKG